MNDENQGELTEAEATELDGLKGEMADTKGANFDGPWDRHYWANETKQTRARELLAREAGDTGDASEPTGVAMTDADVPAVLDALGGMGEIGADFAAEIGRSGAKVELETMASVEGDILADMGPAADDVSTAFGGLPDNVQGAIYKEFASAYTPALPEAGPDDLATFAQSGAGAILTPEWGKDAPRKLATALYRWDRMTEGLSDSEVAEIDDFYLRRLRPQERAAVLRRLAA